MYDYSGTPGTQSLWIPPGFPENIKGKPVPYNDTPKTGESPVRWILFSVGPGYPLEELKNKNFPLKEGFPVLQSFWYDSKAGKGILTRIKMLNHGDHIGTFRKSY
jgi:hypothetical protein